jgi:hypothetical protein
VTHYSAPKFRDQTCLSRLQPGKSRPAVVEVPEMAPGAGLIITLLLSLALWIGMWRAVSSLAAGWLR